MDKLRIRGFRAVLKEKVIDTFQGMTFDDSKVQLQITENKKAILRTHFTIIGWTEDIHFAFKVLNSSVPVSTLQELFDNRK